MPDPQTSGENSARAFTNRDGRLLVYMGTCLLLGTTQVMNVLREPDPGSLTVVVLASTSLGAAMTQLGPVRRRLDRRPADEPERARDPDGA